MGEGIPATASSHPANDFSNVPVEVSRLIFKPIREYDDLVSVAIHFGGGYKHQTCYVDRGADKGYSWIDASQSAIRSYVPPSIYEIELVVSFSSYDRHGREVKRHGKRAEMLLSEVLFHPTLCTIKLEDDTIMGTLDLKLDIVSSSITIESLPDIARQTHVPVLGYIKNILAALPTLRSLTEARRRNLYDMVLVIYAALWVRWRRSLNKTLQERSANGPQPDPASIAAIMAARDNALEDIVLQFQRQLTMAVTCFGTSKAGPDKNTNMLTSLLEAAAESAVIVYQWADKHPHVTWEHLEYYGTNTSHGDVVYRARYSNTTKDLERLHMRFLSLSYEMQQATRQLSLPPLPKPREDILRFLYERTLQEAWEQVNMGPYTNTFECIMGPQARVVFGWMVKDFEKSDNTVRDRDALRRIMTHLAQRSGRLPDSMVLGDVRYHQEPGKPPQVVGGGSFADIYKGIYRSPNCRMAVAIKQLRSLTGVDMPKRIRQMYLEILTCHTLKHPNILSVMGIAGSLPSLTVISPWLNNGNILSYLAQISVDLPATPTWLLNKWINNIAQGMAYLHSEGMAHGDLRGVNILVDDKEEARIADFGLAVYVNGHSKNYASMRSGNVQWFAPELLRPPGQALTARPTPAADVYSFSHVCIELYTSGPPYPELSDDSDSNELALGSFIDKIVDAHEAMRPARPPHVSDELWEMLQRYWCADPSVRPTSADVVRDVATLDQKDPAAG